MRRILLVLALTAFLAPAVAAQGMGRILFSSTLDGYGSPCFDPPTSFPAIWNLYVGVYTTDLPYGGITGAEFSIRGLEGLIGFPPAGNYLVMSTANPAAAVSIGDPLGGGANIAFSTCQSGSFFWLYQLQIVNFGDTELRLLRVTARQPPTNPNFDCSLVTLCDAPVFTAQCVAGGTAYLNILRVPPAPTNPVPPDGATGVPLQFTLQWYVPPIQIETCEVGTIWQNIYFGTDPNPPYVNSSDGARAYVIPYPLLPLTRYYWRVTAGPNSSPVWSFTTADGQISVQPSSWTDVRSLYR